MKKGYAVAILITLCLTGACLLGGCAALNNYRTDGTLALEGLSAPVTVQRDEKGMAYIRAANLEDAFRAHGFISAQDRLFQMTLTRMVARGTICELVGEAAVGFDTRMRTLGFYRNAVKHAALLDDSVRSILQHYVDGVNAYIATRPDSYPLEFKLAGLTPTPWTIEDSLAILYYMSWSTSANVSTEVVMQMLREQLGPETAELLRPVNINPDDPKTAARIDQGHGADRQAAMLPPGVLASLDAFLGAEPMALGSNNWVVGNTLGRHAAPVLANDPHLDARILPGPWYPVGIITPEIRAVGVGVPGIPGLVVFRNQHVAVGVTNAYTDSQDLYVETVDPDHPDRYMEGQTSLPFTTIDETLRIRDKKADDGYRTQDIRIRLTRRGPVVSDVLKPLKTDKVITLRWAPYETMGPMIGLDRLMTATSAAEVRGYLAKANLIFLNYVFADDGGNIGWQVSGRAPIRREGDSTYPHVVSDGTDDWTGWIPFEDMPHAMNPPRGWLGTCNHYTVTADFPYYYTSYAASSFRYRRLKQLMAAPGKKGVDDHWRFQRDTFNVLAADLAPILADALRTDPDTATLGRILAEWDFHDDVDQAAPAVFHGVYRQLAIQTFVDELGPDLTDRMLSVWYFWEEHFRRMVLAGDAPWFDDTRTSDHREDLKELTVRAGRLAMAELGAAYGADPSRWRWGKMHRIELVSPIRRSGFGKGLLGAGAHPFPGSGHTLHRGIYDFSKPFDVTVSASLRMVADLGDTEKVLAVLPGGVTGRVFHPHYKDQVDDFINGTKRFWWFSDAAIDAHTQDTLTLTP